VVERRHISLPDELDQIVEERCINLSKFLQKKLREEFDVDEDEE